MSWNYRAIRHSAGDDPSVALHEVFYGDDDIPRSWTAEPVGFGGADMDELVRSLEMALKDVRELPVLEMSELPGVEA